jgi:hypothetical protein
MDERDKRAILEGVADGSISPDDAAVRLDQRPWTGSPTQRPGRIRAELSGGGLIEVIGDDSLDAAKTVGPFSGDMREDGDEVVISGSLGDQGAVLVNPDLELEVTINAADGRISGVRAPLRATFNTGDAAVAGRFDHGHSRLYCNVGSVHLTLTAGSDVTVAVVTPGQVRADPSLVNTGRGEWTLGSGTARLEIDGHLGQVIIEVAR